MTNLTDKIQTFIVNVIKTDFSLIDMLFNEEFVRHAFPNCGLEEFEL